MNIALFFKFRFFRYLYVVNIINVSIKQEILFICVLTFINFKLQNFIDCAKYN